MSNNNKDKKDGENVWKVVGWLALKTAAIPGAVLGGTTFALPDIGFTAGAVKIGSLAAGYQSTFLRGCALRTAALPGAVLGGTAFALPDIGFTTGVVKIGSLAAGYQSTFLRAKELSLTWVSNNYKDKNDGEIVWKDVGWFALKSAAISGVVLGGTALALPAIGFAAGGVKIGSLAAGYQSAFLGGTIAPGSAFAVLQSVGAVGLAAGTQIAVIATSATAAGAHSVLKKSK